MNVELLAGDGINKAFKELSIKATRTYYNDTCPFQVWEIDKKDLHLLDEAPEWDDSWGWWRYAKGSNMGTPCDFFTINGQFMIGWEPTNLKKESYDSLLTYLCDGFGVSTETNVAALTKDLAKANGMTLTKLFKTYEG